MSARKRLLVFIVNEARVFLSHRLPVALAAQEEGFRIVVLAPQSESAEKLSAYGFEHIPIHLTRRGINPFREARDFLAIYNLLRRLKPDLLYLVALKTVLYGGLAARFCRVRAVVSMITGLGFLFIDPKWYVRWTRFFLRPAFRIALGHPNQAVIFQNPDDLRLFIERGFVRREKAVLILGSGVDVRKFASSAEASGPKIVLLACRMLRDKGVAEFVDAARQVKDSVSEARFVLVGDPDPGNPCAVKEAEIRRWQEEGYVEWWGHRSDMEAVWPQAHIACLPSYREGLPKSLIEAASCARPIVTTDAPGCREIVRHGVNGLLVPVRDAKALAAAILTLLRDSSLRAEYGRRGREMAESRFSQEKVVEATIAVCRRLCPEA